MTALRECACLPWVERCVHFPSGQVLKLGDLEATVWAKHLFDVPRYCLGLMITDLKTEPLFTSNDHAAALAAFREAEQRLLERTHA